MNLSQQDRNHPSWGQLIKGLGWIYGRKPASKEVHWFVENAPDALLALGQFCHSPFILFQLYANSKRIITSYTARLHADTIRYSVGSFSAELDLKITCFRNRSLRSIEPKRELENFFDGYQTISLKTEGGGRIGGSRWLSEIGREKQLNGENGSTRGRGREQLKISKIGRRIVRLKETGGQDEEISFFSVFVAIFSH